MAKFTKKQAIKCIKKDIEQRKDKVKVLKNQYGIFGYIFQNEKYIIKEWQNMTKEEYKSFL